MNSIIQYAWFGYVMLVIAFLLSVATVYYQEFTFFALAVCLYLFTYKLPIKSTILWLMVVLSGVMVGVGLQLPVVNHVLLLLSLFVAVPSLKERKFNAIEISCLLISSLAVLSHNPSIGTTALIGVYIITAFFWQKKSWVSVGFLGIVVTIMFVFFQIRYQYVMLLFLVVYLAIATYKPIIQERFRPQVMLMILLLPIWFLSSTPRTFATGYWINISNQEQSASLAKQQVLSTLKDIEKNEGRSLSYVENTLIGTQTLEAKISTGVVVIGEYLRLLFFPKELNFYYGFAKIKTSSFTDIKFITSLLGIVLTIGLTFVFGNKNRLILIGAVWVATSVLLFSNWVELVAGMVGERLAFTASGGFCLLVGLILSSITSRVNMKTTSYLFILIAGLFSLRTIARNTNWESHLALIEHDIEHLSESVYAQHMYAQICMNEATTNRKLGEEERIQFVKKAEYALVKANTVYPYYFNAQFDLARIYIMQQRFSEAKRYLDNAYALDSNNVFVVEELAKTCFDLNLQSETVKYAEKYLILYPQNENMYEILAYTLFKKGDLDLARHYIEMGLKYYPQGKNLLGLLGDVNDNGSKNKLDKKSE
jgi:tetratricopeptide (TPR) repeat protein